MKKVKSIFFGLILFTGTTFSQEPPTSNVVDYYDELEEESYTSPTREERGEPFYEQRKIDPKFKDKYKGDIYDYDRQVPPTSQKERISKDKGSIALPTGFLNALMYAVLAIIVILVIYMIFKNAGGFSFGKEQQKIKYDNSEETDFEDEEKIENNNFQFLIQKAKENHDFRQAIRYYYLWVLQKLTDHQLIKWNKDKTGYDYYVELAHHPIKTDFSNANYLYDYIWYGDFQLNDKQFIKAETIFQQTLNQLK